MRLSVTLLFSGCLIAAPAFGLGVNKHYEQEKVVVTKDKHRLSVESNATLVIGHDIKRHSVRNLFDGDTSTTWVTKVSDDIGEGERLKIVFDEPVYLGSLTVVNGCQTSSALFRENQRARVLLIEKVIVGGRTFPLTNTVELRDEMGEQTVSLQDGWADTINLFKTKELYLNIQDVYPGARYENLCLSEITVKYVEGNGYVPTISWETLKASIEAGRKETRTGWDWPGLEGDDYRLFTDFLYYVVMGNREANRLFDSYSPDGIGQSESMEQIYRKSVKASR